MGDRCYLNLQIRSRDLLELVRVTGIDYWQNEAGPEDPVADLVLEEANYGIPDELARAAESGLTFIGHHSAGGEYGAEEFVTRKKKVIYLPYDENSGEAVISVGYDARGHAFVRKRDLRRIDLFRMAAKKANLFLEGKTEAKEKE